MESVERNAAWIASVSPARFSRGFRPAIDSVFRPGLSLGKLLSVLNHLIEQLKNSVELTPDQARAAVEQLVEESVSSHEKADFLTALAQKGETVGEITAFARALREKSVAPPIDAETREGEILDVCGTGGDKLNTFNISTTVALVAAACGVRVAKHGNRAVTSSSGSADVLEALGLRIDLTPEQACAFLRDHNFAFFFAPHYHPAFRHIAPARKECAARGQRTIFNFLGPLLNPVRPTAQLIGVPDPALCEPVARVLQSLGIRRGMVVCGRVPRPETGQEAFLDELSTLGNNHIAEFYHDGGFHVSILTGESFPIQSATLEDLQGGDASTNARIIRRLFAGEERGAKRDAVLFNAGAALLVAGRAISITEGWEMAARAIDEGKATACLESLVAATRAL